MRSKKHAQPSGSARACCLTLAGCLALAGCAVDRASRAQPADVASATNGADAALFRQGTYVPGASTGAALLAGSAASAGSAAATASEASRETPAAEPLPLVAPGRPDGAASAATGQARRTQGGLGGGAAAGASSGRGGSGSGSSSSSSASGEKAVMNFVDIDISSVTAALSRFLGRTFLLDPRVKGQITLVSDGEVPAAVAYDMLVAALRMRGFAIVDVGSVSRVVPVADARLQGSAVNAAVPGGGMATRTLRLAYENAESLVPVLKPMIAPESSITAHPGSNVLVITDYVDNLERIARIVESIDTPTSLDTDIVKIRNGVASDIAALAAELLQANGNDVRKDIVVLADPRSNSVIIRSSSPARTRLARDLLTRLDGVQADAGHLHVVYLRNAQAVALARVLRGLLAGEGGGVASAGDAARAALGAGGMQGGAGLSGAGGSGTAKSAGAGASGSGDTGAARSSANGTGSVSAGGLRSVGGAGGASSGESFSANGVTVQADATTNALIISAPEPLYRNIRQVVDLLDQRRAQVMVESLIVEVTEQDAAELGIQWMQDNGRFLGGTNFGGGTGLKTDATNSIDLLPGGLTLGLIKGTIKVPGAGEILNLKLLARALQTKGGVNILSTPNILTLDNEAASIIVGKTVPFVSGQYITAGGGGSNNPFQTVTREDIGLQLKIRPQISEGGTVKLDIYQEVSSIDDQNSGAAGIVTNKRALDTSVLLDDGQIMVLGGLLEDSVNNTEQAVPVLGSIPVLGHLFRYDKRQRVKTNLMVFLRPYVVRDAASGRGVTQDRYQYMRLQQSRVQPAEHPLLPDMPAPILPPLDLPMIGSRPGLDLRPQHWDETRESGAPPTRTLSQTRSRPAPPAAAEPELRSRLPGNVSLAGDPTVLYATPDNNRTVLQLADVQAQDEAVRIARRVRISGLQAYIVSAPGGMGYAVRVDTPRDARTVDTTTAVLRELGYPPDIVLSP